MLACFWSLKGGAGCSVTAALTAIAHLDVSTPDVLIIDLIGDQSAVLGTPDPDGAGISEWVRAGADAPAGALRSAAKQLRPGLALVGPGRVALPDHDLTPPQLEALHDSADVVVVDAGNLVGGGPASALGAQIAAHATRSILVTRACYLALRRAPQSPIAPSAIVLLDEPGRALGPGDVEAAVGAPIAVRVAVDQSIARSVDAGLLGSRVPRGATRMLGAVA